MRCALAVVVVLGLVSSNSPAAADPVNQVKLLILVWAAIGLLGLAATRSLLDKQFQVPRGIPVLAAFVP